jgi:hypothetical protein
MKKQAIAIVFLSLIFLFVGIACENEHDDDGYDRERFTFDTVAA